MDIVCFSETPTHLQVYTVPKPSLDFISLSCVLGYSLACLVYAKILRLLWDGRRQLLNVYGVGGTFAFVVMCE